MIKKHHPKYFLKTKIFLDFLHQKSRDFCGGGGHRSHNLSFIQNKNLKYNIYYADFIENLWK